jgi:hypothetical protein
VRSAEDWRFIYETTGLSLESLIAQVQREAVEACAKECDRYRMRILVACRESTAEYLAATCRALLPKGDG